jgi:hypothetical protein
LRLLNSSANSCDVVIELKATVPVGHVAPGCVGVHFGEPNTWLEGKIKRIGDIRDAWEALFKFGASFNSSC